MADLIRLRPTAWLFTIPVEHFEGTRLGRAMMMYTATVEMDAKETERHYGIAAGTAASWRVTIVTNESQIASFKIDPALSKHQLVSKVPLRVEGCISGTGEQFGEPYIVNVDRNGWEVKKTLTSTRSLSIPLGHMSDEYEYYYAINPGTILCVRLAFYPKTSDGGSKDPVPAYQHPLVKRFGALLESGRLADCKLISRDGQEFDVHRALLAAHSSVFAAMFENNMKEKLSGHCEIKDIDGPVLKALIRFVYTCTLQELPSASLPTLYDAADKYDMDDLRVRCEEGMVASVNVDNALQYLLFAKDRGLRDLKLAAAKLIGEYGDEI
ncbi:TD and POZ domain-containing protein 4-like [Paramacrobiotus metropolitanus]|uniref:TD and POZ domain-containing protein 4-like n=1 Tax=Paramacrobiotus metropolitanus TaxID=2943436 RepID=UPI0024465270|nr:TD and POZ domain-containing protein 4-like [Paramacrobiotus metropolitanus]